MHDILCKAEEDIRLRGLSDSTLDHYLGNMRKFLGFIGDGLLEGRPEHNIRRFVKHLREEKGLSVATVEAYRASAVFLYEVTLDTELRHSQIPAMKKPRSFPKIYTRLELARILDAPVSLRSPGDALLGIWLRA